MRVTRRASIAMAAAGLAALSVTSVATASPRAAATSSVTSWAYTSTHTVTRNHLVNGQDDVVDSRSITLKVSQTTNLRDRQEVTVSWTGAHPTGGLFAPYASEYAQYEEYPMVLLECRGIDSTSVPVSERLSPSTCWTETPLQRDDTNGNALFPAWRVDRYADPADRVQYNPATSPTTCPQGTSSHWVPWLSASGKTYIGGPNGCAGIPPEAVNVELANAPSNETYAPTGLDGTGTSNFFIQTAEANATLGCTQGVPCSLVAVPIEGVSCDTTGANLPSQDQPGTYGAQNYAWQLCSTDGIYAPGSQGTGTFTLGDQAVTGQLWWAASNWRGRFSVPLTFATPQSVCTSSQATTKAPVLVYGSQLMTEATDQWTPSFCLSSALFPWRHVQTAEPEARNLLNQGAIDTAFSAFPPSPSYSRPVVQSPVAVTGFAIAAQVDNSEGQPVATVKLDARLLAKLLTESYSGNPSVQLEFAQKYPQLKNNPYDILDDPEFQALNPGINPPSVWTEPASTLLSLTGQSDVIEALSSYINADPEARAWLDGSPDPWGMVVNPNYKGLQLPVASWPLLDTFVPSVYYRNNTCLNNNPLPWLPLVASPAADLVGTALDMQFNVGFPGINCVDPSIDKLGNMGYETPGRRFLLGVVSLADAEQYQLPTAELQSSVTTAAVYSQFSSDAGRTFVGPSQDSLLAAAKLFKPSSSAGRWVLPYTDFGTSGTGAAAYPGTMLVTMDSPTSGLSSTLAGEVSQLMTFAAGKGQTPGADLGQLPAGYVPMTAANGLGDLVTYAHNAAAAVAEQTGCVPSVTTLAACPTPTPSPSASPSASPSTQPSSQPSSSPSPSAAPTTPAASPSPSSTPLVLTAETGTYGGGAMALILPILAVVLIAAGGVALGVRLFAGVKG